MLILVGALKFSRDEYEQHLQVNHLAPFHYSFHLLLIRVSQSRIISVNWLNSVASTIDPSSIKNDIPYIYAELVFGIDDDKTIYALDDGKLLIKRDGFIFYVLCVSIF